MKETPKVRTRFAPSPTGVPHVGNIRTALFAETFARAEGGAFILRIEDTDQAREIPGAVDAIKESLTWLGISWDEYAVQSERLNDYKKFSDELVDKGLAKVEENGGVRFIVPREGSVSWVDAIGNKKITVNNNDMRRDAQGNLVEGFIILKQDGYPTYHLANVVDDHAMGITHVIRGDDWTPSTPKHLLLYSALGWEPPVFAHVPNVLGPDKKKLSKRHGAKSVLDFKKEGFLPDALFNYLMLIGWSPKNDRTIVSKDEIIREFSLDHVNVAPGVFDEKKLLWMNGEYIRMKDNADLLANLYQFDPSLHDFDADMMSQLIESAKTRIFTLAEFRDLAEPFVGEVPESRDPAIRKSIRVAFESIDDWTHENILNALKRVKEEKKLSWQEVYGGIIGKSKGLSLPDVFFIFGKDKTLKRLQ